MKLQTPLQEDGTVKLPDETIQKAGLIAGTGLEVEAEPTGLVKITSKEEARLRKLCESNSNLSWLLTDIENNTKTTLTHTELFFFIKNYQYAPSDEEIYGEYRDIYESLLPELEAEEEARFNRLLAFMEEVGIEPPVPMYEQLLYNYGRADSYGLLRYYTSKCPLMMDEFYKHMNMVMTKVMRGEK